MPWSIKLGSRIADDIDDGYGWYEDEQEGLGERFLAAIRNKIKTIELNPEAFGSRANKKFREAKVDHFPYLVVYRLNKRNRIIYITSIHHTKKHPRSKYIK
jgi:mRNA-degrading endonuclease RelE of RelBE toxin-antitoxin system